MNNRLNPSSVAAAFATLLAGFSADTSGAGFAIIEQGVKGLGNAFAGGSAIAEDATTIFFNPAGMTRLPGSQFEGATHIIVPSAEFTNQGSSINPSVGGGALSGGNGGDGGVLVVVPNLYYSHAVSDRLWLGLGINVPFGLSTEYDSSWVGRYHALKSELETININPTLAFKLTDRFALGAGISAQYIDATLTNAIDQSTACIIGVTARNGAASVPSVCGPSGLDTPGSTATDAAVDFQADDWSYGFNLGMLFEATPSTRIGLAYRSKISHTLEGDADFQGITLPTALTTNGAFTDQGVSAKITVPESISFSVFHQLNPRWGIMGDVTWTRWNRLKNLIIQFNMGHPTLVRPMKWDNSVRLSLGVSYTPSNRWTFRGGLAFDETPIPNATLRTPSIPGDDRYWIAVGASYQYSDSLSFDIGYAHLFIDNMPIDNEEVSTRHRLTGEFDSSVDIFSAQASWRF